MKDLKVYTVAEWRGLSVNNRDLPVRTPQGIVIHHTAGQNVQPYEAPEQEFSRAAHLARSIQRHHMTKNRWRDSGHHFLISRGGVVLEGRNGSLARAHGVPGAVAGKVILGAHSGVNAINGTCWGIEVEGRYTDQLPTPDAWEALVALCAQLSLWGKTQAREIEGHRMYKVTQCPGDVFFDALPRLREEVRERKQALLGG